MNYANSAGSANAVAWNNVSGKPGSYPPSGHTHPASQISDFTSALNNWGSQATVRSARQADSIAWTGVSGIPVNVQQALNKAGDTMSGNLYFVNSRTVEWQSGAKIYSPTGQHMYICASNEPTYFLHHGVHDERWTFDPDVNGQVMLGTANHKWSEVHANNGSILTSDRNAKNSIAPLDDRYIQLFSRLTPVSYKLNSGTSGRTHVGFISQDIEAAMEEVGLSDLDFAGFCRDQKTIPIRKAIKVKVLNAESGQEELQEIIYTEDEPVQDEYIYSLRYEEFIALNTAVIQNLTKRIENIEKVLKLDGH